MLLKKSHTKQIKFLTNNFEGQLNDHFGLEICHIQAINKFCHLHAIKMGL